MPVWIGSRTADRVELLEETYMYRDLFVALRGVLGTQSIAGLFK